MEYKKMDKKLSEYLKNQKRIINKKIKNNINDDVLDLFEKLDVINEIENQFLNIN
jgi:hypothetical protein